MNLNGKAALVTGGGRGIGRAICLELARQGANLIINYAGNQEAAAETAAACGRLGAEAVIVPVSYTHLDVYKRQAQSTIMRRTPATPKDRRFFGGSPRPLA